MLLWIIFLTPLLGLCCKCEEQPSVSEEYKYSDLVIQGRVLNISLVSPAQTIRMDLLDIERLKQLGSFEKAKAYLTRPLILAVKILVSKSFKGAKSGSVVTIFTTRSAGSCGYSGFSEGREFIVYGNWKNYYVGDAFQSRIRNQRIEPPNTFWTSRCSRTRPYAAKEVAELAKIAP
jgi:hypothetical protein